MMKVAILQNLFRLIVGIDCTLLPVKHYWKLPWSTIAYGFCHELLKKCFQIKPIFKYVPILNLERQGVICHLICTLLSENQGLEKLRSVSYLRKNSVPPHLNCFSIYLSCFFQFVSWIFSGLWYKSEKNSGDKLKKNQVY